MFADAIGSEGLIGGQAADLQLPPHPVRVAEIEPVDRRKTAVLFRAASLAGAMVGGAGESDSRRLAEFGDRVGLAFQIVDDILDTSSELATQRSGEGRRRTPSLVDLDEARRRAEELAQSAVESLNGLGPRAERLRELAEFVVVRKE